MKWLWTLVLIGCYYEAPVISIPLPEGLGGLTTCSTANLPIIVLKEGVLGTKNEKHSLIHERVHVRQMLQYSGGCNAFRKRYTEDKHFRVASEMDAYCAQREYVRKNIPESYMSISFFIINLMSETYDTVEVTCPP